jgi:hypothetical protein
VLQKYDRTTARLEGTSPSQTRVVVAGPSSSITIPGLMTDEVVGALTSHAIVTKVAVNPSKDHDSGLHRAKSLSANFRRANEATPTPKTLLGRPQYQEFQQCFRDHVDTAVALAWPGISNSWISDFVNVARQAGARTVVLVIAHPSSGRGDTSIARAVVDSDLVLVGDIIDATLLSASLGRTRPKIEVQPALSLTGRTVSNEHKRLTAFLPKDDERSLVNILTAFDATPTNLIDNYDLRVIMRYSGRVIPDHIAASYHANHVQLIGEDFSSVDMLKVASDSSAMSVADPAFDSRAYATAVNAGVATVVLAGDMVTDVGRGYVGGLLADVKRPTSIYVAHNHALRLSQLRFPSPDDWFELAARVVGVNNDLPVSSRQVTSSGFA